jgi:hypothetical protein
LRDFADEEEMVEIFSAKSLRAETQGRAEGRTSPEQQMVLKTISTISTTSTECPRPPKSGQIKKLANRRKIDDKKSF